MKRWTSAWRFNNELSGPRGIAVRRQSSRARQRVRSKRQRPKPYSARSINFALGASAHKPEEAFSKVTEAAAKICREHKGSIRNLNYFAFGEPVPRNDGTGASFDANQPANSVGVRVSCALGK